MEKGATVVLEESATGAIDMVNSANHWDAIILDIMMPSPEGKGGATADGLDTGLWILGEILDTVIQRSIPVIVLTNRNIGRVAEYLEKLRIKHRLPADLVVVRSKIETPRFFLPRIVQAAISRFNPPTA